MKSLFNQLDDLSRREFAQFIAKAFLGVGLAPAALGSSAFASARQESVSAPRGRARNVIYLYMNGGMSQLDTFDPKPDADVRGPVEAIDTNAADVRISGYLPLLAKQMDKVAVIRSLQSNQGAHERGRYYMRTAYNLRGTIQHPAMGAWILRLSGWANETLPGNVRIGGDSQHPGAGFLEAKYAPLPIGDPEAGLQNSHLPKNVTFGRFEKRMSMAEKLDEQFRARYDLKQVRAYTDAYEDAVRLMKSKELEVFDLNREPSARRDAYGRNAFGQGCLLARRLVEREVRFVEVTYGGWDTHQNNFQRVQQRASVLDQALGALLVDLERRGMLEETLVVLATEFGRTPKINQNNGRDHYPQAFTGLLAGGGVRGGQAYGKTAPNGSEVEDNPVSIPDFNATIAYAVGLPLDEVVTSPSGRPFTVANKGKPITAIF